jgi:alpha-galactosidase
VLHRINGDTCKETSFLPFDTDLAAGESIRMAPAGGKSSTNVFPFFNFQYGDEGIIVAVGWTGQWAASFDRDESGPTRLRAGMEKTHLKLRPGEKIRSPRILIMPWHGDLIDAHNRFRRLMLFNYVPKIDGKALKMPIALQCFDRYSSKRPEWATEAGQFHAAEVAKKLGCDTLWLDAAWFPDNFPAGVGNWVAKPKEFPNGLRPISDKCHELGLRFVLWFEPERATGTSSVAKERPEFLYPNHTVQFGGDSYLFNLGNPEARRWMTDLLSKRIEEWGIDIYRQDFNINPLKFWQANDAPDRQGMSEILHIMGLYEMWDELRERHPGLWIDNCSGGGTRIDLETCMRSVPLWRSDTACGVNPEDWNQTQSCGLSHYVPLHSIAVWSPDAFSCRSTATSGAVCQWDYLNPDFPMDEARQAVSEIEDNQKYWYGDFYPLTRATTSMDAMIAWQLHRSDLGSGIVLAFRRKDCEESSLKVNLRAVDASRGYKVEFIDDARQKTVRNMTGEELLSGIELPLDGKMSSILVRYQ